jgi:MFS family permease
MAKVSALPVFRAFRSWNYTLYFIGRAVSQFGTWMQRTAVIWLVYSLTNSAFWSGVSVFCEIFPSFLFSALGGVVADKYNRYRVIRITQVASMIQSVVLAALALTHHMMVWAILALSAILGVINAFDVPARQTLVNDVVADKADLPNAISLTTATASLAQMMGPALAGLVLSAWGAAICFLLNAVSFGAVILSLVLMKLPAYVPRKTSKKMWREFEEGFAYLRQRRDIGLVILMLGIIAFLVLPYTTLIPVFAKEIFKGDASTFGYLNSFVGAGSVICTIYLASRRSDSGVGLKRVLFVSGLLLAVGLVGFALARNFWLALGFATVAGFGTMAQMTVPNIFVQSEAAPEMRGRAVGIMLMAFFGMLPLGSLLVGAVSERVGAPMTVLGEGVIGLGVVLWFGKFLNRR